LTASKCATTDAGEHIFFLALLSNYPRNSKSVREKLNKLVKGGVNMEQIKTAEKSKTATEHWSGIVKAEGEEPIFKAGDEVKISIRFPIGYFRLPNYIRGKKGIIEAVIEPAAVNNEEEGYGRNAGKKRHYYRIAIPLTEVWEGYAGSRMARKHQ
jgi:nitrile hydratase subunit beta